MPDVVLPETLTWSSHPWAEDTVVRKTTLLAIVIGASLFAGVSMQSVWIGVVSVAFLFGSISRYLFPVICVLNADGVQTRFLGYSRYFPWSRFRRVALRDEGVFLGTFPRPRRLDAWRGLYLRCPQQRDLVYAIARYRVNLDPSQANHEPRVRDAPTAGSE